MAAVTLAQPAWLLLALLALLLFYFHRQRRAQRAALVGSLLLWRRLAVQSASRARPRPRLSAALLLQGLVLALVALALARPALTRTGTGGDVLILLEAGRAMRATDVRPDRFTSATARAGSDLRGRSSVLLVGDRPVPLAVQRSDLAGVRAALRGAVAGDGTPDWAAAARTAAAWRMGGPARVIAYVSPAQAGVARRALRGLPAEIRVIGGRADNAALTGLRVVPGAGSSPWTLTGAARLWGAAAERTLTLTLGGRVLTTRPLKLSPGSETPFTLRFTPGSGGILTARLNAADVLAADDGAQLILRPAPPSLRVTVVGPLLSPAGRDEAGRGAAALNGAVVTRRTLLPRAGQTDLLMVTDPRLTPDRLGAQSSLAAPVTLWLNAALAGAEPDTVLGWNAHDPLAQDVGWGELGPLLRRPGPAWPDAVPLLGGRGGPLVEARRRGGRTEVRVNMPLESGDWTRLPAFPVFLANLAHVARPDAGARVPPGCLVGLPCALPAGTRELRGPAGTAHAGSASPGESFVPWRAGVYWVDGQALSVNRFAGPDADLQPTGDLPTSTSVPSSQGWAAWAGLLVGIRPLLLCAALAALAAELALLLRSEPALRRGRVGRLTIPQRRMLVLHAVAGLLLLFALLEVPLPGKAPAGGTVQVLADPATSVARSAVLTVWGGEVPSLGRPASGSPGDLAAALEVAAAALPPGTGGRIRVQDGTWPMSARLPDVLGALRRQAITVEVDPRAGPAAAGAEIQVFEVPAALETGQTFEAQVVVQAPVAGTARLTLRRGDTGLIDQPLRLRAGLNRLALPLREGSPGLVGYVLALTAPDGETRTAFAAARVGMPEPVLLVGLASALRDSVARALRVQGLDSLPFDPARLPQAQIQAARRILLLDTPAQALAPPLRAALEDRVQAGGHLLIAGSSQAFGPGGYVGTTLETLSPLSGRVPRDLPRMALALVLDKSGSMNELVGGSVTKLDLIKSAALHSAELLNPESDLTVIAFDSAPKIAVPLVRATDPRIRTQIGRIEAEGGTVVKRALEAALKELLKSSASRKHLILLTDGVDGGIFSPDEYRRLIGRIRATGISVSTVSVGSGMHIPLMRDIAAWGGGRFAQAQDWRDVPSLLVRDTLEQGESAVRSGRYTANWPGAGLFAVGRYIRTTLKPGATAMGQIGSGAGTDPLAATWRVGLGSVSALALTPTDGRTGLADHSDFPALLAPLIRGPGGAADSGLDGPSLQLAGDDLLLRAPRAQASLDSPGGVRMLTLQPDGQGAYTGRLYAPPAGGYSLSGAGGEASAALGVPPVAGASLAGRLESVLVGPAGPAAWAWHSGWPVWALLALLAYFAGLALRYLPQNDRPGAAGPEQRRVARV